MRHFTYGFNSETVERKRQNDSRSLSLYRIHRIETEILDEARFKYINHTKNSLTFERNSRCGMLSNPQEGREGRNPQTEQPRARGEACPPTKSYALIVRQRVRVGKVMHARAFQTVYIYNTTVIVLFDTIERKKQR